MALIFYSFKCWAFAFVVLDRVILIRHLHIEKHARYLKVTKYLARDQRWFGWSHKQSSTVCHIFQDTAEFTDRCLIRSINA